VSASLQIVYASSSGHTEHVIDELMAFLKEKAPKIDVIKLRAEQAKSEDLLAGDILLLACGTWNTGGSEGQLNIHMQTLLKERAKGVDLKQKPCAIIALGDDQYYYCGRATEHLMQFVLQHNGTQCGHPLLIINEPYGQEEKIRKWGEKLIGVWDSGSGFGLGALVT